jgi:hypothetical protein
MTKVTPQYRRGKNGILDIKRGKILLLSCTRCDEKSGGLFFFFQKLKIFEKIKKNPLFPSQRGTLSTQVKSEILRHFMNVINWLLF